MVFSEPVPEMDENGLVTSAVLKRPRGYDKSFHSAFVSFAILQFYRGLGENPNDAPSIAALQNTLAELIEKKTFLTPNGLAVLDQLTAEIGVFRPSECVLLRVPVMLSFTRPSTIRRNIMQFTQYVGTMAQGASVTSPTYFDALNAVQDHRLRYGEAGDTWSFEFELTGRIGEVLERFLEGRSASRNFEVDVNERNQIIDLAERGSELLAAYSPAAAEVAGELIGCFIVARVPGFGGGSVSSQLGAVWLSPLSSWDTVNYAELILHESTHQAQFLDQMVNGWYRASHDEMRAPTAAVISPIRKVPRPYSLAFEGTCVAVTLLHFFEHLGAEQRALELCDSTMCTIVGLEEKEDAMLTSHGLDLLREFRHGIAQSRSFRRLQALASTP